MSFDNCYDKTGPLMFSADWLLGFYNVMKEDLIVYVSVTLSQKSTLLHFSDIMWQNKMYVKSSYYLHERYDQKMICRI